jgi:hypothetical protein
MKISNQYGLALKGQSQEKLCEIVTYDVSFGLTMVRRPFLITINVPLFLEVRDFMFFPTKKT